MKKGEERERMSKKKKREREKKEKKKKKEETKKRGEKKGEKRKKKREKGVQKEEKKRLGLRAPGLGAEGQVWAAQGEAHVRGGDMSKLAPLAPWEGSSQRRVGAMKEVGAAPGLHRLGLW